MPDVSTWTAHAGREPSAELLRRLNGWWHVNAGTAEDNLMTAPPPGACIWRTGPLHTLIVAHVDRACHKRRRLVTYVSREDCDATHGHGHTPMSTIVTGDPYGPEELLIEHSVPVSSLHHAYQRASAHPDMLTVTAMTEGEFSDPEYYHEHSSKQMNPLKGGVVLPFLCVPFADTPAEEEGATADREDLLRAHGYSSYTFDVDFRRLDIDGHREFAALIDDACDDIAGIKADAAARVLTADPLWPMVVLRTSRTWEYDRENVPSEKYAHPTP